MKPSDLVLFRKAKKLLPEISAIEFREALKRYREQHGGDPDIKVIDIPKFSPKILVGVGKLESLVYIPNKKSRKSPYKYKHTCDKELLAVDSAGKSKFLIGKTRIKKDGWLHY